MTLDYGMNKPKVQPLIGVVMDNKFIRFDNIALVMGINRSYVNKISQHILIFLASHSKPDGSFISVSHKTLSDETGYSTKSIGRIIDFLVENKFLIVTSRWRKGCHKPTIYKLNIKLIKCLQSHFKEDSSMDILSIDKNSVDSLSVEYTQTNNQTSIDILSRDLPPGCLIKKVLNNKHDVMNVCENLKPDEIEREENDMSESDNPILQELLERGLTRNQANEILAIEHNKGGYIRTNISSFENYVKNSPEKNTVSMFFSYLRKNWGKWGEAPKRTAHLQSASKPYQIQGEKPLISSSTSISPLPKGNPEGEAYKTASAEILQFLRGAKVSQAKPKSLYLNIPARTTNSSSESQKRHHGQNLKDLTPS